MLEMEVLSSTQPVEMEIVGEVVVINGGGSGGSGGATDNPPYVETIPATEVEFIGVDLETILGWGYGSVELSEPIEIDVNKKYRLTIDNNPPIDVTMAYNEDSGSYACGNTGVILGNDNGEDYTLEITPESIVILLRNQAGTTHTIKFECASETASGNDNEGSGGVEYTDIVYNADDTITLTDTDGNEHIIVCEYEGEKLIGATYDGKSVGLAYEGDALVGVDGASVDLSNAKVGGAVVYSDMIYQHFGVDKTEYPYLFFYHWDNNNRGTLAVHFAKSYEVTSDGRIKLQEYLYAEQGSIYPVVIENGKSVVGGVVALVKPTLLGTEIKASGYVNSYDRSTTITCSNIDVGIVDRYRKFEII